MSDLFSRLLSERPYLLADGATGTSLFAMGLETGEAPELWNVQAPDKVRAHHAAFVEAGADIVLTNSFGANRYRLQLHRAQARVDEINRAAATLAREAARESGREVVVAGSIGPSGEILAPLGALAYADAADAFAEQARALAAGGADILWVETMSSREELGAALAGAGASGLAVVCTLSFDTNGRTMMGVTPAEALAAALAAEHPPVACGANCGTGAADLVASVLGMTEGATREGVFVAKGNCGIPRYVDGEIVYDGTPELMARYACLAYDAGARVIGGCCGTTPTHLRAMRAALESHRRGAPPSLAEIAAQLGPLSTARAAGGGNGGRARRSTRRPRPSI